MTRLFGIFAAILLAGAAPTLAETPKADTVASSDTIKGVWSFVDITNMMGGKPEKGTDRVIYLAKNEAGEVVLSGIGVVGTSETTKTSEAIAVARLRYDFPKKMKEPLQADADYVTEHSQSLFILDTRKNRMWEIGRIDGETLYRPVKKSGKAGAWQEFSKE